MATYPGMSLSGEVRESISLDEDDLSDVEDEVFIRDGKNSYKLAEELNVKRPLMAPRRKLGKPDLTSRLKAKPPCKAFCKPCCYIFAALSILIGIIVLVVILVSIFPLPLDRLRDWVITRSKPVRNSVKLLPCSNLKITDIWATNLPILTTDSPVRILDLDKDGIDDIIFGFGTGDNYDILPPDIFCPIFLGVPPPCEGGVIALNGTNGDIVWRYWTNDTIFTVQCTADLNGDGLEDCLAIGDQGTVVAIDSRNGSVIWQQYNNRWDVYVANFIPDQNNDSVADILSSHTSLNSKEGHLVLISGKTGMELKKINFPYTARTFFMPQLLNINKTNYVIFGTGSPTSPGNLSVTPLESLLNGNMSFRTIYQDHYKGVLTQAVLVDITGDNISDIITAMYNSTVVAINGLTFEQIWNYTIPNSETNVTPTPAYFNDDNVTDFLVVYEKYDNILNYNYTITYVIDGKTGKPIYSKSISGIVATQESGLTLGMESLGFDMFLFWTTECTNIDVYKNNKLMMQDNKERIFDVCRQQFNTSSIMKLNALNQYDQPPGFEIYNSVNKTSLEFRSIKNPMNQIKEYITNHPNIAFINNGQSEIDENFLDDTQKINVHKYGSSSFRHKDNRQGIVKDYMGNDNTPEVNDNLDGKYELEDDWQMRPQNNAANELPGDTDPDYDSDNLGLFNPKPELYSDPSFTNNRDPRSKEELPTEQFKVTDHKPSQTKKKNLPDPKYGIYDYQNLKMAKNRLLYDLNNLPLEILRDTYYKNRESQLRKSKFEQRDISSHIDKIKQNEELKKIIEEERKVAENTSYTLWDLESEKEMQDRENGYWRGKREVNYTFTGMRKITSVGAILQSLNVSGNTIDVVFISYWQPSKFSDIDNLNDCLEQKLANDQAHTYTKNTEKEQKDLYLKECNHEQENLKRGFSYFNRIKELSLGQMTVYRIKIECLCDVQNANERCAKFLSQNDQQWPMYMGKLGDGIYHTRN